LPKNIATKRLINILDNTIEASGKIVPSATVAKIPDDILAPNLSKFRGPKRTSKLPPGTIIEKRGFRLDTAGEIRQISFFKLLKQRRKSSPGNPNNNPKPVNLLGLAEEVPVKIKKTLGLPKLTIRQRKILKVVIERGDIVTGSLAQKILVKGNRKLTDIDIVSETPSKTAKAIKEKLGEAVRIKKVRITTSPLGEFNILRIIEKKTGKVIADVDPKRFAEEGLVKKSKIIKVNELKLVSPQTRLAAKVRQLARGKRKEGKIVRDIELLTSGKFKGETLKKEFFNVKKEIIQKKMVSTLLKSKKQQLQTTILRRTATINFIGKSSKKKKLKRIKLL